jgi:hypothetical protein
MPRLGSGNGRTDWRSEGCSSFELLPDPSAFPGMAPDIIKIARSARPCRMTELIISARNSLVKQRKPTRDCPMKYETRIDRCQKVARKSKKRSPPAYRNRHYELPEQEQPLCQPTVERSTPISEGGNIFKANAKGKWQATARGNSTSNLSPPVDPQKNPGCSGIRNVGNNLEG